jgi:hypothetical protein
MWNCSWTVSEERTMESNLPQAQGFHREFTQMKFIFKKYYHDDEKKIPGSISSNKNKFHHNKVLWRELCQIILVLRD